MQQLHQELTEADEGFKAGHMQGLLGQHEEEICIQEQEELSRVTEVKKADPIRTSARLKNTLKYIAL
jgi:hypothetical protein